ncbi:Alpha/Beta hydrolase protein [Xylariales sp. PMI_506]|nr:Alpha/Beta hydrolase protein [Xylariales sp. PMI_506]
MSLFRQLVVYSYLWVVVGAVLPNVTVGCNRFTGVPLSNGITQWLGLRYAAPPLGNLRFSPPADPPCVNEVQIADTHGKYCLGTGQSPNATETSEDCLFLDVYAPTNATSLSKLPVFFHLQGGGFNTNSFPDLNGQGLIAASNYSIVVVVLNYRVGPYGFIADGQNVKANNGLRDQRQALEWVQEHIAQFGGNPGHVVLGGESAGAASISLHLTAYGGKDFGLFHAAAAESVSFATVLTATEAQYQYKIFATRLGCVGTNSLACLRSKTSVELQAENYNIPFPGASSPPLYMWNPTIDNDIISDYTYNLFANGKFVKVPVIFGDDTNGGTIFAPSNTSTLVQSNTWLQNQFPGLTLEHLGQLDEFYPNPNKTCPNIGCYWRQLSNVYGEMRYMCPGLFISNAFTQYGVPQSWAYRYNVYDPVLVAEGYGVPHTVEANAIWGPENVPSIVTPPASYWPNGTNAHVVPVIQAYWTSFIRTFNPNTYRYPGSAEWTQWDGSAEQRLLFQTGGKTVMEDVDADLLTRCKWWAGIGVSIKQ